MKCAPLLVRGRRLVLGIMACLLALAVWRVFRSTWNSGAGYGFLSGLECAAEGALVTQYYRGRLWARVLTPLAYGVAGMVGAWMIAAHIDFITVLYSIVYLKAALILTASESVEAFNDHQALGGRLPIRIEEPDAKKGTKPGGEGVPEPLREFR